MTTVVLMPVLYRREDAEQLDCSLNPERQRQKLESLLAQGYKVKIANEFEYEHIHFTHYVLETEPREKRIAELKAQIEKMKRCFNCKHHDTSVDSKCYECDAFSNWELADD